jgi:hypothetical protein
MMHHGDSRCIMGTHDASCVCMRMHVRVHVRMRVCVRGRVCVCVCVCVCAHACERVHMSSLPLSAGAHACLLYAL